VSVGTPENHGVVRRDFVEISGGDVAMVGKFAFIPAGALDPFTGFSRSGLFADEFDGVTY